MPASPSLESYTNEYIDNYLHVWATNRLELNTSLSSLRHLARIASGHRTSTFRPIYLCSDRTKEATANGKGDTAKGKSSPPSMDYYDDEKRVAHVIKMLDEFLSERLSPDRLLPILVMFSLHKEAKSTMEYFSIPEGAFKHRIGIARKAVVDILKSKARGNQV